MIIFAWKEGNLAPCGRWPCATRGGETSEEVDAIELMRKDENLNLGRSGSHARKGEIRTLGAE